MSLINLDKSILKSKEFVALSSHAKVVYLYATSCIEGNNRANGGRDRLYIRFSYSLIPKGCMSRGSFYRGLQELLDEGFLIREINGEFHNRKTVYRIPHDKEKKVQNPNEIPLPEG